MTHSRRSVLATTASVGALAVAGCSTGPAIREVDGITTVVPQVYEVELGEYEYAVKEFTANAPLQYVVAFEADGGSGELAVMILTRQQFWAFEEGERFEGYWDVADGTENDFLRITDTFEAGEVFMLVADNTGTVDGHEVDGEVTGRIETIAR